MLRANDQIVIRERATRSFVEGVEALSGKQLKVLTVKFPLFDDQGNVYAAAATCADISEQMALQEELQRLNQALAAREQRSVSYLRERRRRRVPTVSDRPRGDTPNQRALAVLVDNGKPRPASARLHRG